MCGFARPLAVPPRVGKEATRPNGDAFKLTGKYIGQRLQLIPVTHDESTFYKNDRRKVGWINTLVKPTPEAKGEGDSIMVSDFLVAHWGRLRLDDWEARLFFRAGKNRDGYFTNDELLAHVDNAIDIFESKTHKFATGLFLFDNAPSHQKRAADALSARKMPKGPHATWTNTANGPKMCPGRMADGSVQQLYWPAGHPTMPGWFKGMEQILRERGLYRNGMNAQCPGFKYANRAARFISAYSGGLNGEELAYVQRRYKGHRMLPQFMIDQVKASIAHIK
ncbi:hypothetical protein MIND_00416100 [Mycena indigotica]|uniref:Uncharacterized protein n=1 Tax=Mycena indigotica TaxID=2126181 RepID=A0A8H6SUR2_9AGAR|nr:uncharacterized protein MIND_00416100 [Mycena indigotica]KAF7306253.1 hypothetical protein MIND_00416100 [Mycena indigotica]